MKDTKIEENGWTRFTMILMINMKKPIWNKKKKKKKVTNE